MSLCIRRRVPIRNLLVLPPLDLGNHFQSLVISHSSKVGIHHAVGILLSADYGESAVEEASVNKHFPNYGTTPVVRGILRENSYSVVIVSCFQNLRNGQVLVNREADHVPFEFLE